MNRNTLRICVVGNTTDGAAVIQGVFPLVNSEGIPLDLLLNKLHTAGCRVDISDFMVSALEAKWPAATTMRRLEVGFEDAGIYSPTELTIIREKLADLAEFIWSD